MHSKIYQVAARPISLDEYVGPSDFYDNSSDFADYIGDEDEGDDRKEDIGYLAEELSDVFDLDADNDALVFKGLDKFKQQWMSAIREKAAAVTEENILDWRSLYMLEQVCRETHIESSRRFSIDGGIAEPMSDLIKFAASLKPGQRLYIGAVIDYHL